MQVDRIEEELMEIVPGVRYVDLETDRGRFSTYVRQSSMDDDEPNGSAAKPAQDSQRADGVPVQQPI